MRQKEEKPNRNDAERRNTKSLRTVDVPEEEERRIEEPSIRAWQKRIKTKNKK